MLKLKIPIILKVIYIQTIKKKPKETIEQLLEKLNYDKNIFAMIKFKYMYLPNIQMEEKNGELMNNKYYKNAFEKILNLLKKKKIIMILFQFLMIILMILI